MHLASGAIENYQMNHGCRQLCGARPKNILGGAGETETTVAARARTLIMRLVWGTRLNEGGLGNIGARFLGPLIEFVERRAKMFECRQAGAGDVPK
jgi:hypothetical protein